MLGLFSKGTNPIHEDPEAPGPNLTITLFQVDTNVHIIALSNDRRGKKAQLKNILKYEEIEIGYFN